MATEEHATDATEGSVEDTGSAGGEGEARASSEAPDDAGRASNAETSQHVCPVAFCPIGMALSSMERSGPDALEHMLAAGREVLLAAKAILDARTGDVGASPNLEKIEVH
jgi:hypothetical protein